MNKRLSKIISSPWFLVFFIFSVAVISIFTFFSLTNISYADTVACAPIQMGTGGSNVTPPPQCATSSGNFTNPFPDGWSSNRLDNGYDGTFKTKTVAPFDGRIIYVCTGGCGWGGSYFVIMSDANIPEIPTHNVYFAEGIIPTVHFNQHVTAGQTIGTPGPNGYGCGTGCIEWGVAASVKGNIQLSNLYIQTYSQQLGSGHCTAWTTASRAEVHTFYGWAKQNFHYANPVPTYGVGDCAGSS